MATTLYFRSALTGVYDRYASGLSYAPLAGGVANWIRYSLSTSAGSSATSGAANTIGGPTAGVEVFPGNGVFLFISPPLAADTRIYQSISFNMRAVESSMSANAAVNCRVMRLDATTGSLTEIAKTTHTGEASSSSETAYSFSVTPSDTTFNRGDRLVLVPFFDDAGTMGNGYTATFYFNGSSGATGDSYATFTDTVTFDTTTPAGTTVYPTGTDAGLAVAPVDYEAWTSRGGGVATSVTNTASGPTSGVQTTVSAGGSAVEWYTKQLQAVTLSGGVLVNLRGKESDAGANANLICEIAVTAGDGTGASVWGRAGYDAELTTSEAAVQFWVAGDDLSITAGQRLRILFYVDDSYGSNTTNAALAAPATVTMYYAGSAGATGDTYLTFPVTLAEYSAVRVPRSGFVLFQDPGII